MSWARRHVRLLVATGAAVVVLAGASTVGLAAAGGAFDDTATAPDGQCTVPNLPGTVVDVTLTDWGPGTPGPGYGYGMGPGAGIGYGPGYGYGSGTGPGYATGPGYGYGYGMGMMRVLTDRSSVPAGTVSLRVANTGSLVHELVVLPLRAGQQVGERAVGPDGTVDEAGSLGEASNTCGPGTGDGIAPGGVGWVTLHLAPGRYELLCNLPGHYAAGMETGLTVR